MTDSDDGDDDECGSDSDGSDKCVGDDQCDDGGNDGQCCECVGRPGVSWSLIICLSAKRQRLCMSSNECFALQLLQDVGSSILPLSMCLMRVAPHIVHLKNAAVGLET